MRSPTTCSPSSSGSRRCATRRSGPSSLTAIAACARRSDRSSSMACRRTASRAASAAWSWQRSSARSGPGSSSSTTWSRGQWTPSCCHGRCGSCSGTGRRALRGCRRPAGPPDPQDVAARRGDLRSSGPEGGPARRCVLHGCGAVRSRISCAPSLWQTEVVDSGAAAGSSWKPLVVPPSTMARRPSGP